MAQTRVEIQLPSGVSSAELGQLETDLRTLGQTRQEKSKDMLQTISLVLLIGKQATDYVSQGVDIATTVRNTAKKLHDFFHPSDPKALPEADLTARQQAVIVYPDGTKVALKNYSVDDLTKLLTPPADPDDNDE